MTNGDLLGVINATKKDIQATRGPIVTSAIKFNEASNFIYTIEDSSIPKMFSGISHLLSQGPLFRRLLSLVGLGSVQEIIKMISPMPIQFLFQIHRFLFNFLTKTYRRLYYCQVWVPILLMV